jgi:hypothetical protein
VTAAHAVASLPPTTTTRVKLPSVPPPLPEVAPVVAAVALPPVELSAPVQSELPTEVEPPARVEPLALAAEPAVPSQAEPETLGAQTTEQTATPEPTIAADIASAPAVEPEPQPAAEPSIAASAASETEPAAEAQADAQTEPAAEAQADAQTEPAAEAQADAQTEPAAEASLIATATPDAQAEAEPASETEPSAEPAAFEPPAAEAAPQFNSTGSDAPVVLRTPVPRLPASPRLPQQLWSVPKDWLPRAQGWSQKTLRNAPRTLVISAPFVALLGIWLAHSLATHHNHTATQAVETPSAPATVVAATEPQVVPAPQVVPTASPASDAPVAPAVLSAVAEAPSTSAPAAALAAPTELVHALTRGLPALEALAAEFPADAQVAIALAGQQAQAQRYEAAVATVERAIEVDPSSAQNGKVMGILWRAAQSSASDQSFLYLRKLGARGSDIAFDLATTSGVRESVRTRARAELTNYLALDASSDTRAATALLLAPDCTTRKSLLDRAESDGGKRTLAMLERFARGSGCTSSSEEGTCNSCLMGSPVLTHALSKLNPGAKP